MFFIYFLVFLVYLYIFNSFLICKYFLWRNIPTYLPTFNTSKNIVKAYNIFEGLPSLHCVKSVQIRNFFWFVLARIRTEYGKIQIRKNSVFGSFFLGLKSFLMFSGVITFSKMRSHYEEIVHLNTWELNNLPSLSGSIFYVLFYVFYP